MTADFQAFRAAFEARFGSGYRQKGWAIFDAARTRTVNISVGSACADGWVVRSVELSLDSTLPGRIEVWTENGPNLWGPFFPDFDSVFTSEVAAREALAKLMWKAVSYRDAEIERSQADRAKLISEICILTGASIRTASAEPRPEVPGPSGDLPSDFQEGQWWLTKLDEVAACGTDDMKRAVAVVRNLMKTAHAQAEARREDAEMLDAEFEVMVTNDAWDGCEQRAATSGPRERALSEAMNYARQAGDDEFAEVFEVKRTLVFTSRPATTHKGADHAE